MSSFFPTVMNGTLHPWWMLSYGEQSRKSGSSALESSQIWLTAFMNPLRCLSDVTQAEHSYNVMNLIISIHSFTSQREREKLQECVCVRVCRFSIIQVTVIQGHISARSWTCSSFPKVFKLEQVQLHTETQFGCRSLGLNQFFHWS